MGARYEKENMTKTLILFALPIIMELLVFELYNLVDTFLAGRFVSDTAIAPILVVYPLQRLYGALAVLVGVGMSTILSRHIGSGDKDTFAIVRTGALVMLGLTLPITLVSHFAPERVLTILGATPDILEPATFYLKNVTVGAVFLSMTTYLAYVLISYGNTTLSLFATSMGAMLNVVYFFVFGAKAHAVALSTAASQMTAFFYIAFAFLKKMRTIRFRLFGQPKMSVAWPILVGGFSAFLMEAEESCVMMILNRMFSASTGTHGIMVLGMVMKVYMFIFVLLFGIVSAMQPMAAYYYGAEKRDKLLELLSKTFILGLITSTVMWVLFQVFSRDLISAFVRDPMLIEESARALRIVVSAFPIVTIYYIGIFLLQAKGENKTTLIATTLRLFGVLLPAIFFFGKQDANMIFWAYPLTDIIASVAMAKYLYDDLALAKKWKLAESYFHLF